MCLQRQQLFLQNSSLMFHLLVIALMQKVEYYSCLLLDKIMILADCRHPHVEGITLLLLFIVVCKRVGFPNPYTGLPLLQLKKKLFCFEKWAQTSIASSEVRPSEP